MIIVWLIIVVAVLLWLSWVSIGTQWEDIDLMENKDDRILYSDGVFLGSTVLCLPSKEMGTETSQYREESS
jgi:hypothetical protein